MSATFITPVEVSPGSAGSWVDVDVSANIPAASTGVILHCVNTAGTASRALGLRKNGSSDNRTQNFGGLSAGKHQWATIGVDASRIFEAYSGNTTDVDIYLVGYFESESVFFTNAVDKSIGATGEWTDVDVSSDTGADTAIGVFLETSASVLQSVGFRVNGSTDNRYTTPTGHLFFTIGVDGSEIFEHEINNTAVDLYLVGYIKTGATFNTNGIDRSLGGTGAWADLTALPAGAKGGIYHIYATSSSYSGGLRKNGSSEDIYLPIRHVTGLIECDTDRLVEGEISNTGLDFFENGYFTVVASAAASLLPVQRAMRNLIVR